MNAGGAGPVRFVVDESRNVGRSRRVKIAAAVLEEGRKDGLVIRTATQRPPASP